MKKKEFVLREYVRHLSDEDLRYTSSRLSHRLSGDVPEVLDYVAQSSEMDRILGGARNAYELYDLIDEIKDNVDREMKRRSFQVEKSEVAIS